MNENDKISIPFVMVGSENRPASQQDIDDMKNAIQNVLNGTASAVITHHNIEVKYIYLNKDKKNGKQK